MAGLDNSNITRAQEALSRFFDDRQLQSINLKDIQEKYQTESDEFIKQAIVLEQEFEGRDIDELEEAERTTLETKVSEVQTGSGTEFERLDNSTYDKFEAAIDGLDYLIEFNSNEIGETLEKAEVERALEIIKGLDNDANHIAIPDNNEQITPLINQSPEDIDASQKATFQEQNLFAAFFRQSDQAKYINEQYINDNNEIGINSYIEPTTNINVSDTNTNQTTVTITTGNLPDTSQLDSSSSATYTEFEAALNSQFPAGQYLGLNGSSLVDYVNLHIEYAKSLPFPHGQRLLASSLYTNIAGRFTLFDPVGSILYSNYYLPGDGMIQTLESINLTFQTRIANALYEIAALTYPEKEVLLQAQNPNSVLEILVNGSEDEFNLDEFKNIYPENISERFNDLRAHIIERAESEGINKWSDLKQIAIDFFHANGDPSLASVLEDDHTIKLSLFRSIVAETFNSAIETARTKQEQAKGVLDSLRDAFRQPGSRQGRR